ncbi:MAG: hypothetical protein WBA83_09795 [Burkholderiaceae bacterium]
MPRSISFIQRHCGKPLGALALALLLAGCAQQRTPDYYATAHDSTASDAQMQAQGRSSARAPSQIQLGFGGDQKANKPASAQEAAGEQAVVKARPLAEAKTFLGTIPCAAGAAVCSAQRLTLTLAPSGAWRSRAVMLDKPDAKNNIVQHGCWDVIGTRPLRIVLKLNEQASLASMTFLNDNVLRIDMINNATPTLEYRLTRQADIDAINELDAKAPQQCG